MPGVLLLGGPTASGKSELALALAERFDAEIVGADSRQIYRGMPIGTAAPSAEDRGRVPHHLVDFLDPRERYSAARFARDALAAIEDIHARGHRAIVVGGTGFYLRALAGDVALADAFDADLRARLAREARLHPPEVLHAWLAALAPARAHELAPGDTYRVLRALEIALARGRTRDAADSDAARGPSSLREAGLRVRKVVLTIDDDELVRRIERRVDGMLAAGLLEEAARVGRDAVAADAVGYPQALAYLDGFATQTELRAALIRATRRYAKRQRTWFRSESDVTFVAREASHDVVWKLLRDGLGW
jgi:tRNA dimethylallyltransferase